MWIRFKDSACGSGTPVVVRFKGEISVVIHQRGTRQGYRYDVVVCGPGEGEKSGSNMSGTTVASDMGDEAQAVAVMEAFWAAIAAGRDYFDFSPHDRFKLDD